LSKIKNSKNEMLTIHQKNKNIQYKVLLSHKTSAEASSPSSDGTDPPILLSTLRFFSMIKLKKFSK